MRFDFSDWWWLVKWDVHVYDPRSQITKTLVMEYPGTSRAEGAAVTAYASRDLRKKMDHILVIPHHETSERSEPEPRKSPAQIKREVDEILAEKRSHGQRGLSSEDARRLAALPDAAICNAHQGGSKNLWYATVALDQRWSGDPDFMTAQKTKQAAIQDCAARVRADLHGDGKYAPHWSDYDVTYRLLPYWEQRRS